jgi:Zn-dependent protease with chaperone function
MSLPQPPPGEPRDLQPQEPAAPVVESSSSVVLPDDILSDVADDQIDNDAVEPVTPPETAPEVEEESSPAGSVLTMIGPSGLDGLPARYDDGIAWLRNGILRHPGGTWVGLIVGWTGIWTTLWGAAIGLVLGALIASGFGVGLGEGLGVGQASGVLGTIGGGVLGALFGFLAVARFILDRPLQLVLSVVSGGILGVVLIILVAAFERLGLSLRGYRRLSRQEVRRVAPLVKDVADAMELSALPRFAMADILLPNAWTHMRTVVLTTGLLQTLNDQELRAVLAHELEHWRAGDAVGLHFVWAAAWPIALNYSIGMALAGKTQSGGQSHSGSIRGLMWLVGWAIAWPASVIIKFIITPVVAASQRRYEYAADAAAAKIGFAADLSSALRKMSAFEGGRTGWEQAMAATHPPTELRLEALEPPQLDDFEYQEDELRAPTGEELRRLARFWRRSKPPKVED